MRLRHRNGSTVHLAYCTNVHAAEDVEGIRSQLRRYAGAVRRGLGVPRLGVGLWLSARAVAELREPRTLDGLRHVLGAEGLEVVTLNGFPYRAFQAERVKHAVYRPDWTDRVRLDHTLALAQLLAYLLPNDADGGSISTLPLGWRAGWSDEATDRCLTHLRLLADGLAELEASTGRSVRVGLEPEPGCIVERVPQAAAVLRDLDPARIGLCLDACHLAVQFEEPQAALELLAAEGLAVVKAQLSSALRLAAPDAMDELEAFVEPRFLHQVRQRGPDGSVSGVDDLEEALAGGLSGEGEWRVHFHVPVHLGQRSTQAELLATMDGLVGGKAPLTTHLEVETYTWSVLPGELRPQSDDDLVGGLVRELGWVREQLCRLGLEEMP